MSDLRTLYDRNDDYAATFGYGELDGKPRIPIVLLTCVDPRVDPTHLLRLRLGDAYVLRNPGGRATDTAMLEVRMIHQVLELASRGGAPSLSLAIIHHTDCGMEKFTRPLVADAIKTAFGSAVLNAYGITDSHFALKRDVDKALADGPSGLAVSGHLYDVEIGKLEQVVAPATAS